MSKRSAFRKPLPLAALVAGAVFALLITSGAEAQDRGGAGPSGQSPGRQVHRNYGVGGTSLTLSDIWGPAKMPPAPTDFGPHFDYPPDPLNGAPLHDPYPN
jgi:hypothetical protein